MPESCTVRSTANLIAPQQITDPAQLVSVLDCPKPAVVDLSGQRLLIAGYMLSPASIGVEPVDDGEAIPFVVRQRPP